MSPIDIQDLLERARNAVRVGDHEQAEKLLKKYLVKNSDNREASLLLGTAFARQGKLTDAGDQFISLLAKDPRDVEALNNAAVIYRRQGKFHEALNYLKEAIDADPDKAEFHYNIGNIHKQLGNYKAATAAYSRVIELNPGYVSAYNNLGTIHEQLKEYDKAYSTFRKGLGQDRNNPTLHFNYGVALEANGQLEEAAAEYRYALRSKPGWRDPMNNLGIVLFKQGYHDKATEMFNRVLTSDPFNAEARNNMGVVMADQGRIQDAIKCYRQAMEADPKYTRAAINLERALELKGDFSDALVELEKLVKLSPDSAEIRNRLAALYLRLERYPEALEQAQAALDWEPESVQALKTRGAVQLITGNDTDAQACFEKILSLDPCNYSFLLDLADIHFRRREYKDAEERIRSYLIRRPNDRTAKLLLGKLYAEMGNLTHAIQVFEELSRADPNDTEALSAVAELHREAGSLEKAVRTADNLVNLQGKRATTDDLLDLNKSLEFYETAVTEYSSSVKEMWNRNIKLLREEKEARAEEDVSLLMGSAAVSLDEEYDALFTEGIETFAEEEDSEEGGFGIFEEEEELRYQDPLDALAEDTAGQSPAVQNHETRPKKPSSADESDPVLGAADSGSDAVAKPEAPKMPRMPDYPAYPPYTQTSQLSRPKPVKKKPPEKPLAEEPLFEEPVLLEEIKYAEPVILDEKTEIPSLIGLLNCLKNLAEDLPNKERELFHRSNFPITLDSVIDSLRNLDIIKESAHAASNGGDINGS
jgi:tetratricopeptide (TPR) repeat protein